MTLGCRDFLAIDIAIPILGEAATYLYAFPLSIDANATRLVLSM